MQGDVDHRGGETSLEVECKSRGRNKRGGQEWIKIIRNPVKNQVKSKADQKKNHFQGRRE